MARNPAGSVPQPASSGVSCETVDRSYFEKRGLKALCRRHLRSPLGIPGAALTAIIAIVTLIYQLQDPAYQQAVLPVAIWLLIGVVYFALFGRHKLVLSPAEKFAVERGRAAYEAH